MLAKPPKDKEIGVAAVTRHIENSKIVKNENWERDCRVLTMHIARVLAARLLFGAFSVVNERQSGNASVFFVKNLRLLAPEKESNSQILHKKAKNAWVSLQ